MTTFSSKPALNNKNVIATIASDGHVYSLDAKTSNFVKMTLQKEEGLGIIDPILKASAAEITEMGKQMLYYAEEDNIEGVQEMLAKGSNSIKIFYKKCCFICLFQVLLLLRTHWE